MPLAYDPQIEAALLASIAANGVPQSHTRGDWRGLRHTIDTMMAALADAAAIAEGVLLTPYAAEASDGAVIALRWYCPAATGPNPGPACLYLHGGGMIGGNLDVYDPLVRGYVSASQVPMLAVEYRLAPEHPHPVPVEDCHAALAWLHENAALLHIDASRIAVMGDSAGGGLAACTSLLARDRGPPVARQILVYPMLDDRTIVEDPTLAPTASWSYDNNATGWAALLAARFGSDDISPSAAAARAQNLIALPPAYIEVGALDIFRDEDIAYATRLAQAGVPTELHVHPGAPHGFDAIAPRSDIARRAMADRIRVLRAI